MERGVKAVQTGGDRELRRQALQQKLPKLLLLVDGHDDHFFLPALQLLRESNIRMFCLPPGCTSKLQPLDVGVFGALGRLLTKYINEEHGVVGNKDWARHISRAYAEWEALRFSKKMHPMTNAFRHAGLVPPNIKVFTDRDWHRSDQKLKLHETHEDVLKAKAFRVEELNIVLKSQMAASKPQVAERLKNRIKKGGFDLNMSAPTDDDVVMMLLDKEEKIESEAAAKEERAVEREKKSTANKLKKEETAARVAAKKKAREEGAIAVAVEKAAKAEAQAAKQQQAAVGEKKRKAVVVDEVEEEEVAGDPHAKQYASVDGSKRRK